MYLMIEEGFNKALKEFLSVKEAESVMSLFITI